MRPLACDRSRAWISLRLDDELSRFEHVLLGAHMATCRDCRRFAEDVAWQTQVVRSAGLEPVAPIKIPSRHSWRWPALGVSTAAIAASLAALAIGLRGPSQQPQHSPPTTPRVARIGDSLGVQTHGVPTQGSDVGPLRGFRG
jgi:hypothetical protein